MPSPTLTNPDMVLPNDRRSTDIPGVPSTPRSAPPERPPSPSYLRKQASAPALREASSVGSFGMATPKKDKRGYMSRKMLLLRSRTASSTAHIPRSAPSERGSDDYDSTYGSSPILMDVGNLLADSPTQERLPSAGTEEFSDDELAGMPQFLAKYDAKDAIASDDELDDASPAAQRYGYSVSIEGGLEEKRRKQEEDEQNSAILSKRAEAILANAKKRLNLMEGNLRGARDLVAPLTAANLKRATSVSSSHVTPASIYGNRSRPICDGYHYDTSPQRTRKLQAQASSPTMGREYFQGHLRGFSETEVPERPHTSLERTNSPVRHMGFGRFPVKAQESPLGGPLRGSRSHDSLGSHASRNAGSRDQAGRRESPDSNLEPLVEDDTSLRELQSEQLDFGDAAKPSLRTDGLREQMSSLRGRISSLKERAREDNLKRRSMQSLREPSPLNNASVDAPEYFYTSSPTYGSPILDTSAGKGWKSQEDSPTTPQSIGRDRERSQKFTGSRNAFAEQARGSQVAPSRAGQSMRASPDTFQRTRSHADASRAPQAQSYGRTPGGTAVVKSSGNRCSHHQDHHSVDMPGAFAYESPSEDDHPGFSNGLGISDGTTRDDDDHSEAGASQYEDASEEVATSVVAHEDREDAFDYEHFFLHSAMGTYGVGNRSSSSGCSESVSSVETAKGPTAAADDLDDERDYMEDIPAATPETPETLREIERSLHKRTFSNESISTLATFATATEGRESPEQEGTLFAQATGWPLPPLSHSVPSSRPSTAVPTRHTEHRSDSSSERADSGVGMATSTKTRHRHQKSAPAGILALSPAQSSRSTVSPPMSPRGLQNPATVAVNALLEPGGRTLGLKDKALLFGLVEQLRVVCRRLQEGGDGEGDVGLMQRRLEEAKRALVGVAEEGRHGTR